MLDEAKFALEKYLYWGDCEKWLNKLFELDKEVVWYTTLDEAIKKIEYYLSHDDERIKVAQAWYSRVQDYRIDKCFKKLLNTVFYT